MIHDITIPPAGESITSAAIARWYKNNGVWVEEGELLVSLETDKVSTDLYAPASGSLKILVNEGEEVSIGSVIGTLNDEELRSDVKKGHDQVVAEGASTEEKTPGETQPAPSSEAVAQPVPTLTPRPVMPDISFSFSTDSTKNNAEKIVKELPEQNKPNSDAPELFSKKSLNAPPPNALAALAAAASVVNSSPEEAVEKGDLPATSLISGIKELEGPGSGSNVSRADVSKEAISSSPTPVATTEVTTTQSVVYGLSADGRTERIRMTPLRRKVAAQLVSVQTESAILSTFNECDMSAVMKLRKSLQEDFVKRHGVKLGFMSFFIKSVVNALKAVPELNAQIDGNDIVKKHYYDISVAVGTDKGLVVPVIRDCDKKSFGEIEQELAELAEKARTGKITMPELQGGVFTISNGGVYGSLLSTPIINPPQSGIMGLHAIKERPIAENGQVVIRPMMYLALSYDHRLVDGKQAVSFLVRVKECIEDPTLLLLDA